MPFGWAVTLTVSPVGAGAGLPFYAILCVAFGTVDPIFQSPVPVWNPLHWNTSAFPGRPAVNQPAHDNQRPVIQTLTRPAPSWMTTR